MVLQKKPIFVTSYKILKVTGRSFLEFELVLQMQNLINEQPLSP